MNTELISVVGLGKLGLPFAVCLASRGFKVIGVDIDQKVVDSVNRGRSYFYEPNLEGLIKKFKNNLSATTDYREAIDKTDVTFILVPTPSYPNGLFSNKYVKSVLRSLSRILKKNVKPFHQFIVSSTIVPNSIEHDFIPLIEKNSNCKVNIGFGISYSPDFVALGEVINGFLNPDFVLIGESGKKSGDITEGIFKKVTLNNPPIVRITPTEAEITKISLNCYVTTKISFANSLANFCEKFSGVDVDNISKVLGLDKRISPYYLKGGTSFGGTCFPRDTQAFISLAKKHKINSYLIKAVDRVNNLQNKCLLELILKNLPKNKSVTILGTSFKPNTTVIEESVSSYLIPELLKRHIGVTVYDSLSFEQTQKTFGDKIMYAKSLDSIFKNLSLFVITISDPEFIKIKQLEFIPGQVIIDCWRFLKEFKFPKNVKYVSLGVGLER